MEKNSYFVRADLDYQLEMWAIYKDL